MTDLQWVFEFHALQKKEKTHVALLNELAQYGRQMMIDMLGLDVGRVVSDDPNFSYIIPLSMMTATPDLIVGIVEDAKKAAAGEAAGSGDDEDFDKLSQYLMEATRLDAQFEDGDMLPFVADIDTTSDEYVNAYMHTDEYKATHRSLVKLRNA